jgi:acyl-CoA dehydrogenase
MDFSVPREVEEFLAAADAFIDAVIAPLEDANPQFFDHRREHSRTDWDADGIPTAEWEALLGRARELADAAGFYRYAMSRRYGGRAAGNLPMAIVREHLARRGNGLHNDLQNEHSIVGNLPVADIVAEFGDETQRDEFVEDIITHRKRLGFGVTEPGHGSDATWMSTRAVRRDGDWVITGAKRWNSNMHRATHDLVFARTSGSDGEAKGITAFLVPMTDPGIEVIGYDWTFNMPTDHARTRIDGVRVPDSAILGDEGDGLRLAQHFFLENRIRQAAASLGAAQFCVDRSVERANERVTFGQPLAQRQAIQWPLVELHTEAELVRNLVRKAAWLLDTGGREEAVDLVSMANYRANRLACDAADRAIQVFGGEGYSRNQPFEHIYRHHRRYRITEGSDEIQIRKVAGGLFGFTGRSRSARWR